MHPMDFSDFEKVLDLLPEPSSVSVNVFKYNDFKNDNYYLDGMSLKLNMSFPTKLKVLELVKSYWERGEKAKNMTQEEEWKMYEEQKNIFTFEKAKWYIGDLQIELDSYHVKINYSSSFEIVKELFEKLCNIKSLELEIKKLV